MTHQAPDLKKGNLVKFRVKVFRKPYTPAYDAYRGETFRLVKFHYSRSHIELECVSNPEILVQGYVHPDEVYALRTQGVTSAKYTRKLARG